MGPSHQQLPPLHLSSARLSENVTYTSSERGGQGDKGKGSNPSKVSPNRGDGSGGGVGTPPSSASANADPHGAQQQLHATQLPHNRETANVVSPREGGQRGAVVSQMQQGLSDGTMSMLQVLSQSAASAAETAKEKCVNSGNSSSSSSPTTSLISSGTQSSFEYN